MAQRILKPLELGDLFDEAFDLYKRNFVLFVGIIALVTVPISVISWFYRSSALRPFMEALVGLAGQTNPNPSVVLKTMIPFLWKSLALTLVTVPLQLLSSAAITWSIARTYLGHQTDILSSYKAVLRRLFPLLVTSLISWIALAFGFAMCFLPGLFLLVQFAFISEVFIIENKAYFNAMSRSWNLAINSWGKVVLVGILAVLIAGVASAIISTPTRMFFHPTDPMELVFGTPALVQFVLSTIVNCIVTPIILISFVLLYYDIRVRKEGFDLELLAQNMGERTVVMPTTTSSERTEN